MILKLQKIIGNVRYEKISLEFTRDKECKEWTLHKKNNSFSKKMQL